MLSTFDLHNGKIVKYVKSTYWIGGAPNRIAITENMAIPLTMSKHHFAKSSKIIHMHIPPCDSANLTLQYILINTHQTYRNEIHQAEHKWMPDVPFEIFAFP